MDPHRAAQKITEEIIEYFRLPRKLCYGPINAWIWMAIGVGFDLRGEMYSMVKAKAVAQLDKNGRVMTVYPSTGAAAKAVDRSKSKISDACRGKQKTCGGYGWRFADPSEYYKYSRIKR